MDLLRKVMQIFESERNTDLERRYASGLLREWCERLDGFLAEGTTIQDGRGNRIEQSPEGGLLVQSAQGERLAFSPQGRLELSGKNTNLVFDKFDSGNLIFQQSPQVKKECVYFDDFVISPGAITNFRVPSLGALF